MSDRAAILEAAFTEAAEQAKGLSEEYLQRLDDFRVHGLAVLADVEAGTVTPEQALVAAEQEANAVKSTLLSGAYDAAKASQAAALSVVVAVLKAALVAV